MSRVTSPSGPVRARQATPADVDAITAAFATAFFNDPVWGPVFPDETRRAVCEAAVQAAAAVGYRSAGTVEMIYGRAGEGEPRFFFLEMNTRLQVEHPITEETLGVDLAVAMLRIAAGEPSGIDPATLRPRGHAIEHRIYAEDPVRFLPSPGEITVWEEPSGEGIRVDSGVRAGVRVTHFYDPLLAKLVVHGPDRETAIARAEEALRAFRIEGVKHNIPAHLEALASPEFRSGDYDTGLLDVIRARRDEAKKAAAAASA